MRIGIGTSIVGQQVFKKLYVDDIAGTPTAAYSVDKVVSTYTDAVVEVRRTVSAVTVEADVAFDGDTITLDSAVTITSGTSSATTLGQFVAASGYTDVDSLGSPQDAFVATWYDQAGSNDATQTTASDQPKIVNAGALVTENGKVALDFDGVNDFLLINGVFTTNITLSAFAVVRSDNVSLDQYIYDNSNSNTTGGGYTHRFLSTGGFRIWSQDATKNAGGGSTINGQQYLTSRISYGTTTENNFLYQDGVQTATNSGVSAARDAKAETRIGMSELFSGRLNGVIQELIAYNSDKSALRTAIEDNINGRFNIYA